MKSRLRDDLLAAMKGRHVMDAKVIRALIAAIDNAEAPPAVATPAQPQHPLASGSAEVQRLVLNPAQVQAIILADVAEREQAAAQMDQLGQTARAAELRAEALVAGRYVAMD
jgi:uncharacterized protein YqeY